MTDLPVELQDAPQALRDLLVTYGFAPALFATFRERARSSRGSCAQNLLSTAMEPPWPGDQVAFPSRESVERANLEAQGRRCIAQKRLAVIILAGGMATRFGGVVKACVDVVPGMSFLALKLADIARVAELCASSIPVFLMTSFATDASLTREAQRFHCERVPVATFAQFVSLRLNPDGDPFRDDAGQLSPYATGHGDLVPALRRAGLLERLMRDGVEHLFVTNVDNVAAFLEPALVGLHETLRQEMSFEVVAARPGDQGGAPARVGGIFQVIEGLRQPAHVQTRTIPWFSTNCMYFTLRALERPLALDWFCVEKNVEGRPALQYERLMNQMSAFLSCKAIEVERFGTDARFLPIKARSDLEAEQQRIVALLRQRGLMRAPAPR